MNETGLLGTVRAATDSLALLLALACLACAPRNRQVLPASVAAHFESANAWDVYQVTWSDGPDRRLAQIAGCRFDAAAPKVTVDGEKLEALRAAVWAGVEAKAGSPPQIAAVLAPEFLVVAHLDGRDMALAFHFGEAPRVDYYTGDPLESGMVNSDFSSRGTFLQLFAPESRERTR